MTIIKEIKSILINKQSISIFCLFLLFFPLKTQLQNTLYFLFDFLFRNGTISEVYTYNYRGLLLGCEQGVKLRETEKAMNLFQIHGLRYINYLPSLIAFVLLFKRWKNKISFSLFDWFLLIITCFSILNSLEDIFFYFKYYKFSLYQLINLTISVFFFLIGMLIFVKIFSFRERIQTIFVGIPAVILGMIVWFKFIGPQILPLSL